MEPSPRINFSGVVVSYNEAHILRRCLDSLDFCEELIVVDLGSTDDSLKVAQEYKARILTHELVPYPNVARQYGISRAANEWVVTIDPDEVFPKAELQKILAVIAENKTLAGVRLPWQFYFRGKELRYSVWGRPEATKCAVVHRDRAEGTPFVHKEFVPSPDIHLFPQGAIAPIQHYWMSGYKELFEKMWRYIRNEGKSKYVHEGKRFSWPAAFKYTGAALRVSLFRYRGWRGGFKGIFLSFFHAWYVFMSWLSLKQYEQSLRSDRQEQAAVGD